ncbi:hypothetical protein CFC21_111530, partial [Triticum aestivum]
GTSGETSKQPKDISASTD